MCPDQFTSGIRPPAVAGSFYPRSAAVLRRSVGDFLDTASPAGRPEVRGIIAPHAGYVYSGKTAGVAFAAVRSPPRPVERVVIVGPAHYVPVKGIAAPTHAAFDTPLGRIPVDVEAVRRLAEDGLVSIDDTPHRPEHAVEVELPFLQALFGEVPIIPLLFGAATADAVAAVLFSVWTNSTLLVVSSDLSHFEPYEDARRHDRRTAEAIEAFDEAAIGPTDACGHLAIRGALIEAARRGLSVERLDLCNSGDTAGRSDSVVGYGAWTFSAAA